MTYSAKDKNQELTRYDERAEKILLGKDFITYDQLGAISIPRVFRQPYLKYEKNHKDFIKASFKVLEIAAGTGVFSKSILDSGARSFITDISSNSLKVFQKRYLKFSNKVFLQAADMEKLPFRENNFDIISSAGSLSYGDNKVVMNEIYRLLKPGGIFICIDSLNENPIYRFNRWISYKRGRRTFSTLINMPTLRLIEEYKENFDEIDIRFYGSLVWMYPLLKLIIGNNMAVSFIEKFDSFIGARRSAFKFVLVLRKKI